MFSAYDLVYSVEAVAKHFRWETFVFIGHSLGAALGKMYNVSYPGKLSKLIDLDPINFYAIEPEDFPKWYNYYFKNFFDNYEKYNMPKGSAPIISKDEALSSLKKKRGLPEDLALATLERWSEPAGEGLIRYTYDQRIRVVQITPLSINHIRKIYTSVSTPMLVILADESVSKGLFRNTSFLQEEASYPARNCRVRTVAGNHDVHVIAPHRLAPHVAAFLTGGIEALDSKAKL
ncbi:hypothetical protein O3G_MSEX012161 [Manduca sexta]|uniref:Uncharacterized protein n=1 Tax=Manduca sexta TaxID=7130 RepID=A0A921ZNV7_MANSE|nr:hypothetical protein O3G_MSEX012161 [Manduca sexta]